MTGDNLLSHQEEGNSVLNGFGKLFTNGASIMKWGALLLLLASGVMGRAAGLDRQEKTLATTANPHIALSNFIGHILVRGWDRQAVHVLYATTSPQVAVDIDQLPLDGPAGKIHLTTRFLDAQAGTDKTVFYTLDVPMNASLEIHNTEGRVEVNKLFGEISVDSAGGNITVTDVAGRLLVRSIAGDIEVLRSSGTVEATSICGNLRLASITGASLKAQTTSGNIVYEGELESGGDYLFREYSGDINLYLPASASFDLNKTMVRGNFSSEIPPASRQQVKPRYPGSHTFLGSNVSSTAAIRVSSFSGNVHIHRQP